MTGLREAAEALASIIDKALSKGSRGLGYDEIYPMLHELYRRSGYVPITRIEDLFYNTYMLRLLVSKHTGSGDDAVNTVFEWAAARGIESSPDNPYDVVRVMLDALFETCLYGSTRDRELLDIVVTGKRGAKKVRVTYRGLCGLLRGLSEFAATQHSNLFILHIWELVSELYRSYMGRELRSILDIPSDWEKLRVHVTAKFFPMVKEFFAIMYLFKCKWLVTMIINPGKNTGFGAKKPVDPTYLGRITSELLDSMMGVYYDETALIAYDTITKAYLHVFQEFSRDIEKGDEISYIESHPSMLMYVEEILSMHERVTPQIKSHLERRGDVRLGEVKQDVKDYLFTLFHLDYEGRRRGYVPVSGIGGYDIVQLIHRNALARRDKEW